MGRACSNAAASARRSQEAPPPGGAGPRFDPHVRCLALSGLLRGTLCERLVRRPARRVPASQFLYFMGEPAKSLYFLKSGLVKTSRTSPAGDEMILQLNKPGDILGESCFCTGARREYAVTLESSEVVEILLEDLLAQLRDSPEATLNLVTMLCERLGDIADRLQSLALEPTAVRLVRTLLLLADTLGETHAEGTHIVHYVRQEELAQMIAARREVVSALLNRLRADGLIDYSRKGRISVRRPALERYLVSITTETG
ncbi:MAG: Crp/Fnr family transcriptional regulator [Gemmatimonadaceae bacterium]